MNPNRPRQKKFRGAAAPHPPNLPSMARLSDTYSDFTSAYPFYLHFTGSRYLSNGEAYSQTYTPVMSLSIRRTHEDSDLVNEGKSEQVDERRPDALGTARFLIGGRYRNVSIDPSMRQSTRGGALAAPRVH